MANKLTFDDVLKRAQLVEKTAEEFYRVAAQRFAGTDMQMLLVQLSEEESGHADIIEDIRKKYTSDVTFDADVRIEGETKFLDKFEQISKEGTMEAVAEFALQMEKAAVENYTQLADAHEGELKKIFVDLANFEKEHANSLIRMTKDLSLTLDEDWEEFHAH